MVVKEANNAGTTGHVVTAVEKEQWHASACKLAMQVVKILRWMLHWTDSIQAWLYPSTSIESSTFTLTLWENCSDIRGRQCLVAISSNSGQFIHAYRSFIFIYEWIGVIQLENYWSGVTSTTTGVSQYSTSKDLHTVKFAHSTIMHYSIINMVSDVQFNPQFV